MAWHRLSLPVVALLLACAGCDTRDPIVDDELDVGGDPSQDEDRPAPPPISEPITAYPCDTQTAAIGAACETDGGTPGTQQCLVIEGQQYWTPCEEEEPTCYAGDGEDDGCVARWCVWTGEEFAWREQWDDDCNTPLVLNFERGPVEFAPVAAATFDLSTDGSCTNTAWPTAPWLALDRDGDGFIRSGAELFGNATAMHSGAFASNGFAALAELDSNLDGKIDAADARFSELVLWSDLDDDRIGAYDELRPLADTTVVSIDLGFSRRPECDAMGNCAYERASFEFRRAEQTAFGEVVDVHLLCQ